MSTAAAWTGETVRPSDLEQLGSAVFFSTEQFEESGQTQTLLTVNSVFRHVVTSFGFLRDYDMPGVSYSDHPLGFLKLGVIR